MPRRNTSNRRRRRTTAAQPVAHEKSGVSISTRCLRAPRPSHLSIVDAQAMNTPKPTQSQQPTTKRTDQ